MNKRFSAIRRGDRWGVFYGDELISDYQWKKVETDIWLDGKHVIVWSESGCGVINDKGRLVIAPVYNSLSPYANADHMWPYRDGRALLASYTDHNTKAERMGLIDIDGRVIAPCVYPFIGVNEYDCLFHYWDGDGVGDSDDFSHRLMNPVSISEDPDTFDVKYGLLNSPENVYNGEPWQLFPPTWDEFEYISTAFIDETERHYSFGSPYANIANTLFFLRVRKGDKYGIADTFGRVVTPCVWDEIGNDGFARRGEKTRYIDLLSRKELDEPVKREVAWTFKLPPRIGESAWRTTMIYYRIPNLNNLKLKQENS